MKLLFILLILQIQSEKSGRPRDNSKRRAPRCYCGEVDTDFSDKDMIPIEDEYIPPIRIIHGKLAERNEWPWMALLMMNPTKDLDYDTDRW